MPNLKEVKNRISSVVSTQQITKAMKMVAAAKLRRSQERIAQIRPFTQRLSSLLANVSVAQSGDLDNWYTKVREEKKILIVAISADRGLCGSFNSNVFKGVSKLLQEKYQTQVIKGDVTILAVGRKVNDYFSKRKINLINKHATLFQGLNFEKVSEVGDYILNSFQAGKYDKVEVVYNEFKNVATQVLVVEQLLPVLPPETKVKASQVVDYLYQPNEEEIVAGLIPKSIKAKLFKALLDSDAAFNGAQMTAMDKATENAGELLKELRLSYNRTRQAAITKEILEIVAGAEALKSA